MLFEIKISFSFPSGIEKVTGETETKMLELMKSMNGGEASDAGVPPSPLFIVHVPATLLQYPGQAH